jgi:D-alanyl-lipoteichoic acid acyltransferase DltB (MBOAT superfamily)
MLFNSYEFLFGFVPLTVLAYFLACRVSHWLARSTLIVASLVFYYWWSPAFTLLLLLSIAFNYSCVLAILWLNEKPVGQTAALAAGIIGDLAFLGYFKYLYPLLHWFGHEMGVNIIAPEASLLLPLGISFFTFTQIGFLIDSKVGAVRSRDPLDFILFVTFFPHLIAGPILHHREMMPQFAEKSTYQLRLQNVAIGLSIFAIGLAKKVLIADQLSPVAVTAFGHSHEIQFFGAWLGALYYTLQLYFDFSGYADMAVGVARLFGIRFPANFDAPFKASSIIAFWQRWHMTLTRYLNMYLYNPMALYISRWRSRLGMPTNRGAMATPSGFFAMVAVPTYYTMGIAGVWHGAGAQYLVFGLIHATYLCINQTFRVFNIRPAALIRIPESLLNILKTGTTFVSVVIGFVFFRASSLPNAMEMVRAMAGFNGQEIKPLRLPLMNVTLPLPSTNGIVSRYEIVLMSMAMIIVWASPTVNDIFYRFEPVLSKVSPPSLTLLRWEPNVSWAITTGIIAAISILYIATTSEFLYFQF